MKNEVFGILAAAIIMLAGFTFIFMAAHGARLIAELIVNAIHWFI